MHDDFAIAFAAGNIDRDSRIKKKKIVPKSQLGQGINIFVKISCILYPLNRMSVVSRVVSAHFMPFSVFPLLKKVISSVHNYLITVYCSIIFLKSSIVV